MPSNSARIRLILAKGLHETIESVGAFARVHDPTKHTGQLPVYTASIYGPRSAHESSLSEFGASLQRIDRLEETPPVDPLL